MAEDKLFFKGLARLNRAKVPAAAIALQGGFAIVIALSGRYEQILNYVVSVDVVFFALSAACIFIYRRRSKSLMPPAVNASSNNKIPFHVPGHPFTTLFFIAACLGVAFSTISRYPRNSLIGLALMLSGLPVYLYWRSRQRTASRVHEVSSDQAPGRSE